MYDVIVVGGGPGGALTAYLLADRDLDVAVLEKEEYPRYKPCGGGLPPHAVTLLQDQGVEVEPYIEYTADKVRFLYDFEDPVVSDLSDSPVVMVNRADFDQALIESAVDRGASVFDGTSVEDVKQDSTSVDIKTNTGDTFEAQFVVGADGANSRVARSQGLNQDSFYGVAMDAEVDVDSETFQQQSRWATFNINYVDKGYGWIFPKDGYLGIGVGGYDNAKSYPDLINRFIDRSLPEGSVQGTELFGHPLPFYEGNQQVAKGRVGLIGDAGNMVDSLSGEGIFYSLKAGRLIADCIDKVSQTGERSLDRYQSRFEDTIASELEMSAKLAKLFFKYPRKCYEQGVKRETVVSLIKQVVQSEAGYDEVYGLLWDEIKQRSGRKVLSLLGLNSN